MAEDVVDADFLEGLVDLVEMVSEEKSEGGFPKILAFREIELALLPVFRWSRKEPKPSFGRSDARIDLEEEGRANRSSDAEAP